MLRLFQPLISQLIGEGVSLCEDGLFFTILKRVVVGKGKKKKLEEKVLATYNIFFVCCVNLVLIFFAHKITHGFFVFCFFFFLFESKIQKKKKKEICNRFLEAGGG